jgi:ubiquinone/menaquinone biosynthesis C-methylase UbiE
MIDHADRFDGLAEAYEMHRPAYPEEAFRTIAADLRCDARVAVDVGAGPGNSTAPLIGALGAGWSIVAIEPGRDMRRVLSRRFAGTPQVQVSDASAEEMRLPSGLAGLVVACTAYHWFDRPRFFRECARVLAPGGVVAVVRNRRKTHPLIDAFDRYIETHSVETSNLAQRDRGKEPSVRELAQVEGFASARSDTWAWSHVLTTRGLIDLYLTRSTLWGVVRRIGLRRVIADLEAICTELAPDGQPIRTDWETTAKWVRKSKG